MKKMQVLAFIIFCAMAVVACHKKGVPSSSKGSAGNISRVASPEELTQGENIFRQNCNKCHKFHEPASMTQERWGKILPKMERKAGLNADQSFYVTAWVNANAKHS
jgi:cytochrome c2